MSKKTDAVTNLDEFTDLALSKYFPELHKEQNELSDNLEEQTNLLIEQSRNAVFDGLKNAKGIVTKTNVQKAYKRMDEDAENTKILKSWLDTNDAIASIKKEGKALTAIIEQSIQSKMEEDKTLEYICELIIINQYIELRDVENKLKKEIKEKEQELDDTLYSKYPELTEEEIKLLVVNDKWLISINNAISGEIDQISQHLTNRIKELAERYDTPLPATNKLVADLESTVNAHLEKMGFAWK